MKPKAIWVDATIFKATEHIQCRVWASDFERPDTLSVVLKSDYDALMAKAMKLREKLESWPLTRKESFGTIAWRAVQDFDKFLEGLK